MPRINLQVPFAEKDEVKRLGARWDGAGKVWYVPDGVDVQPFSRWLPVANSDIGLRSISYYIAQCSKPCWKCGEETRIFGFLLPAGVEVLEPDDEVEGREIWVTNDDPIFVHYVTDILDSTIARMKSFSASFRLDFSNTTQDSYWMNHCDHCGMKQGDFQIYCEPDGAFLPMDEEAASQIVLHHIDEPFVCNGDHGFDVSYFDYMRKA